MSLDLDDPKPKTDFAPNLIVGIGEADERTSARIRETFFVSVIVHLVVILIVVTNPDIFQRLFPGQVFENPPPPKDVTMLYEPQEAPKVQPPKVQPAPQAKPLVEPPAQRPVMPRLPQPPVPPPVPPKQPGLGTRPDEKDLLARQLPPIGLPEFREPAREPPGGSSQGPKLEPVPDPKPTPEPSQAQLQFPTFTAPERGTDAILRGLARQNAAKGGAGVPGGIPDNDPNNPNMNIPGPQILSDTMGVDFQPYLLRIYLLVRRNWYSVIPEIARLGKQGRVALEFSILRDGKVPDLVLRVGSGTQSLDSAALASIRLSTPFPALPAEFPGSDVRLRFVYLYNLSLTDN